MYWTGRGFFLDDRFYRPIPTRPSESITFLSCFLLYNLSGVSRFLFTFLWWEIFKIWLFSLHSRMLFLFSLLSSVCVCGGGGFILLFFSANGIKKGKIFWKLQLNFAVDAINSTFSLTSTDLLRSVKAVSCSGNCPTASRDTLFCALKKIRILLPRFSVVALEKIVPYHSLFILVFFAGKFQRVQSKFKIVCLDYRWQTYLKNLCK